MEHITVKEFVSKVQVLSDWLDCYSSMFAEHLPIDDNPVYDDFRLSSGLVSTSLNRLSKSIDKFKTKLVEPTLF